MNSLIRFFSFNFTFNIIVNILFLGSTSIGAQDINYRSLSTTHTPLHSFEGAVLHNDALDSVALYRFTYDANQLKSIVYELNGSPKPIYENYTCSSYVWSAINLFEYPKGKMLVKHLDYQSKIIPDKPSYSEYTLDKKNRPVSLRYLDKNHNPAELNGIYRYEWKYKGDSVLEVRFNIEDNIKPINGWFPYEYVKWKFDKQGNPNQLATTKENWISDPNGITINFKSKGREIIQWTAMATNNGERSIKTGPKVSEVKHDFNENGYLVRTRFFDKVGNPTESAFGHAGFERVYNSQGNRLSYNFIDVNGEKTIPVNRGYGGQCFRWDADGRLRLLTYYQDINGKPVFRKGAGYSQIQFLYDETNMPIGRLYLNEQGKLRCDVNLESYILIKDLNGGYTKRILCPYKSS
ncbi:hypothetical protein M3P19_15880 [Muricauda sp. 2012CJ35-5]|uniref:YD repeat-containing protein n=1 Tax=Flagellimonas spongiicola TaxID=2942208 RepID=A0ABT0PVV8_9FLAO|nr:hypothetical protein [Allomuricauda spongiicola]MCL6275494.1 hypothetical protein [Allomuricauda spongiicola]